MNKVKKIFSFHMTGMQLLKIVHETDSAFLPLLLLDTVLQTGATFLGLFFSAELIDSLLGGDFYQAFLWAFSIVFTHLLTGTASRIQQKFYQVMNEKCTLAFQVKLREKALSLSYETIENPQTMDKILFSERTAAMYGGLGQIALSYQELLLNLLKLLCSLFLVILLCLKHTRRQIFLLTPLGHPAFSFLFLVLVFLGTALFSTKAMIKYAALEKDVYRDHTRIENKSSYLMQGVFCNYKAGMPVRIFQMQEMLLENGIRENEKVVQWFDRSYRLNLRKELANLSIHSVFTFAAYLLVAVKVLTDAITVGAFTKYAGALNQFGDCFGKILFLHARLEQMTAYMQEFLDFLALESTHETGTIPVEKRLDNEFELCFEDVSFHYPGSEEMILKHINCRLAMKHKMAVVGQNGAGKTTFIKLLCRLYDPTEGQITLNGVDIRKYDEQEYRDLFGVVFQDFKLFSFPVRENLAAGYEADDARLWQCLEDAGAAEAVRSMPCGLDTVLYKNTGDGVEISGGEAQKLALARALSKDAPLVILDEPTAALDPVSEAKVYAGFDKMVKDKTSIYISHRMSSCRFCDDIIVFDNGAIVERGGHDELLAADGKYAAMWNAQAKYYEMT